MKTSQHHDATAWSDVHDVDVASMTVKQLRRLKEGAAANAPVKTTDLKPVPPRSRLSDEGRKRIVEATKKFWAAKRRAAQAVQGPRPTKGSVVSTKKAVQRG